jgi:hypothetical protein
LFVSFGRECFVRKLGKGRGKYKAKQHKGKATTNKLRVK